VVHESDVFCALDRLGRQQHGAAAHRQILACGVTSSTLARRISEGMFIPATTDVVRFLGAPSTWGQHVMVATLTTGGVASHRTAAALHGLDGFRPGVIEVTTDRWQRRRRERFIVHEAKDLIEQDRVVIDGIPCTSLIRTLLDLPAVCGIEHAGQALDDACRRYDWILMSARQRFIEFARRGRNGTTRGRAMLNERLADPILEDSRFEKQALTLIRDAGLPTPVKQFEVQLDDRAAFIDLAWPEALVGLECDSLAYHFGRKSFQSDRTRRRQLTLRGWRMYEFTYDDITLRRDVVTHELRRALAA
jgi:very-short-patch-repair endonuclease